MSEDTRVSIDHGIETLRVLRSNLQVVAKTFHIHWTRNQSPLTKNGSPETQTCEFESRSRQLETILKMVLNLNGNFDAFSKL